MSVPVGKLRRPRLSRSVIDRTWLFARPPSAVLAPEADGERPDPVVTLVSAPPGAGKTTLLASWARTREAHGDPVAWVSLDRADDDPAAFWDALLLGVRGALRGGPDPGEELSASPPARRARGAEPIPELNRLVEAASRRVWLLLDDVQELTGAEVHAELDALLRHLPAGLELVLASRRDPALALQRLRLAGRLREIRAGDLALDRDEARQLLAHHGVVLGDEELSLLVERTDGWAAGLRLAALTLADAADPAAVVRRFAGDDRAVADYLTAEVLAALDERQRGVLRLCALPEQLTGELAVVLTGDPEAGAVLEQLYRDNALVNGPAQPGGWYRVHPLLRSYLLAELESAHADPALRRDVVAAHGRIATWFAGHGQLTWALEHATRAGDDALAVRLLLPHGPRLLAGGRPRILRQLIAACAETVRADPAVARLDTLALLDLEEFAHVPGPRLPGHDRLARTPAAAGSDAGPLAALLALHHARHEPRAAGAVLASSAAQGADRSDDLGMLVALNRGIVALVAGRLDEADADLGRAQALAAGSGNAYAGLRAGAYRTALVAARGQYRRARALADATVRAAVSAGDVDAPEVAGTVLLAAHSARQELDGAAARRLADQASALLEGRADVDTLVSLRSLQAVLDVDDGGDPLEGCRRLREGWTVAAGRSLSAPLTIWLSYAEHRCAWLAGRLDWAHDALSRLERLQPGGDAAVLAATDHLARGRPDAARHRLGPVLDGTLACLLPVDLQQAWLLEALLSDSAGQSARSHEALRAALDAAAESGALRAFVDVPGVAGLLQANADRFGRLDPLADRIRAAARARADHTVVPLTPRELAVLADLPAQLTLEEIAERRQVSVNTVKTHVRSIYQKLGASSRREAVAAARRRGLL
ncbi:MULTISPECIES: LuxR C-terminal-related transcriptional regulator [unclassified Blastococcus]